MASSPPLSFTVQACTELDISSSAHKTARAPNDRDMLTSVLVAGSRYRPHKACEREKVDVRVLVSANVLFIASFCSIYVHS